MIVACLANMESLNAHLINEGLAQPERLTKLNEVAIQQMRVLVSEKSIKRLDEVKRKN